MALKLERLVRAHLGEGRSTTFNRVLIPLVSGSFDGMPLAEAARRCREDAARSPDERSWILRIVLP